MNSMDWLPHLHYGERFNWDTRLGFKERNQNAGYVE
jgi:hypothetical protein